MTASDPDAPLDPIIVRRATITRWCTAGRRVGYALYGLATALYFVGLATSYSSWMTNTIVACLVIGGVILIPSIVFGYAARAAERDELATER